mmetsp:Transcript_12607/g.26469  ORF Transcript_12607/g.26469 Transcript_12607/m.26469 type:complete len:98 (+) Transcript_12607:80-373(+)
MSEKKDDLVEAFDVEAGRAKGAPKTSTTRDPVVGASFRSLRALVQRLDPNLQKCGLEKAVAKDGSVDWVRPGTSMEQFLKHGQASLFLGEVGGEGAN